jgi:hypothetical protein
MAEKDEQLEQMRDAVDRKADEAEAKSRATRHDQGELPADEDGPGSQAGRTEPGRPQDVLSARDKNAGKGKKTADKWNQ